MLRQRIAPQTFNFAGLMNGAEGDRTPNLCIANTALSQLSYGPLLAPHFAPLRKAGQIVEADSFLSIPLPGLVVGRITGADVPKMLDLCRAQGFNNWDDGITHPTGTGRHPLSPIGPGRPHPDPHYGVIPLRSFLGV